MAGDLPTTDAINTSQPKNMAVAAKMREYLAEGRWSPGEQIPPARQLAQTFGVSLSPILQALQMLEREALLVRRPRVGTFVAERTAKKQLIAFISMNLDLETNIHALWGFDEEARRREYSVLFANAGRKPEHYAQEAATFLELGATGIAFIPPEGSFFVEWNRVFYSRLASQGTPVVTIAEQPFPEDDPAMISAAIPDGRWQGRRMTAHLIERGHTSIAYLYGRWCCTAEDRKQGVMAELAEQGLPAPAVHSLSPEEMVQDGELYDVSTMLGEWLDRSPPITAVVCVSDYAARIVYTHAASLGLKIPDDIAVVGFDDMTFAEYMHPPLTTIRTSYVEMGRSAAELLLAQIHDPKRPPRLLMSRGELIVRDSCGRVS